MEINVKWILKTRIFFFLFQVMVSIFPDHQHSKNNAFIALYRLKPHPPIIEFLFGGFDNWDSEYYLNVANVGGYQIKECHAFFPLYPFLMRFMTLFLYRYTPIGHFISFHSLLVISGVTISNISFIISAITLYLLTIKIFTIAAVDYNKYTSTNKTSTNETLSSFSSSINESTGSSPSSCVLKRHPVHTSPLTSPLDALPSVIPPNLSLPMPSLDATSSLTHNVPVSLPSSLNDQVILSPELIKEIAFLSVLLYTVNPATIFMCTAYTESLFALFTFSGMLAVSHSRLYISSLLFAGACATRSNGIVLIGFILYHHMVHVLKDFAARGSILGTGMRILRHGFEMMLQVLVALLPFLAFQMYSYHQFCPDPTKTNITLCNATLPLPYSYVQREYWELGFLSFYELKQIPHFISATPMFILAGIPLWRYFKLAITNTGHWLFSNKQRYDRHQMYIDSVLFPYMMQLLFLLIVAAFFMYIQVVTRFVASSSPVIYWFAGVVFLPKSTEISSTASNAVREKNGKGREDSVFTYMKRLVHSSQWSHVEQYDLRQWITVYCVIYIIIGFVMHCNFLPWV